MARGSTVRLADNAANDGLREVLKSARVTQRRDRVTVTATLTPTLINGLAASMNSADSTETEAAQGASK